MNARARLLVGATRLLRAVLALLAGMTGVALAGALIAIPLWAIAHSYPGLYTAATMTGLAIWLALMILRSVRRTPAKAARRLLTVAGLIPLLVLVPLLGGATGIIIAAAWTILWVSWRIGSDSA